MGMGVSCTESSTGRVGVHAHRKMVVMMPA